MHLQFHVTVYVYVKCFVFKELFISYGSYEKVLSGSKTCKEAEFSGDHGTSVGIAHPFYWMIILIIFEAKFLCRNNRVQNYIYTCMYRYMQ